MKDIASNIPAIAAVAIILLAVIGVLVVFASSLLARPLDATAQGYVNTLLQVTIGIAVGGVAVAVPLYNRMSKQ